MKAIRAWRASQRKSSIESIEKLIDQASRMALSRYTRSAQRAKWTRLAGQLIWYKDQILRAMTWEALEQDVNGLMRQVLADRAGSGRIPLPAAPPWATTIIKKRVEEGKKTEEEAEQSSDRQGPKSESQVV